MEEQTCWAKGQNGPISPSRCALLQQVVSLSKQLLDFDKLQA